MTDLDEQRFTPISYTREELVEEAECLTGADVAVWLAAQPDPIFEEIMSCTRELIWGGASYLGSLQDALSGCYAARPSRSPSLGRTHSGRPAPRRRGLR